MNTQKINNRRQYTKILTMAMSGLCNYEQLLPFLHFSMLSTLYMSKYYFQFKMLFYTNPKSS